jgi:hypothetical protein
MKHTLKLFIAAWLVSGIAAAHDQWSGSRPDGHAPIGVMGDHLHKKGEWMASYRFMRMDMKGSLKGNDHITNSDIISPTGEGFLITPTKMTMDMHMLGMMYAPTDDVTMMLMVPYIKNSMDHRMRTGTTFTTGSDGIGDVKLTGLYRLFVWGRQQIHMNLGLSFPTGSINEKDNTPAGNVRLPYPMQLGSGTYDLLPGLTYLGQDDTRWSWGSQLSGVVRLQSENDNDYHLGNRINATGWFAYMLNDWWSTSLRVDGQAWGDIHGADPKLNPNVIPTADPNLRGGKRVDLLAGVNFYTRSGTFKGNRLAVEAGYPAWQNLDGPQLKTRWTITAGWQYAF